MDDIDIFSEQYYGAHLLKSLYLQYDCGKIVVESSDYIDEPNESCDINYCIEVLHMFYNKYQGKKSYSDYQWRFNDCKITITNHSEIIFSYKNHIDKKIEIIIKDHPSLDHILSKI